MENREKMKPLSSKSNPQNREEHEGHLPPLQPQNFYALLDHGPFFPRVGQEMVKEGASHSLSSLLVTRAAFPLRKHIQGPVVKPPLGRRTLGHSFEKI